MNSYISVTKHLVNALSYYFNSYLNLHKAINPISLQNIKKHNKLKIYTYTDLPKKYSRNEIFDLRIVYETYIGISDYFTKIVHTDNPLEADYFFVPIFLHKYQFKNQNPIEILPYLTYLSNKKDHLIVATGDYSQRGDFNKYGNAYRKRYAWLENICLLALESTSDLKPNQDIGIMPLNTLVSKPKFNDNNRTLLYSFLGELNHLFLPKNHVRSQLASLESGRDTLITAELDQHTRNELQKSYNTKNDYEILARNSIFTLCPAGYGKWTYRFFQSIQWGSIPVLISDTYHKPFSNYINYDDFCITIKERDIGSIDKIIRSISHLRIESMQQNLEVAQNHFTLESFFKYLHDSLISNKGFQ